MIVEDDTHIINGPPPTFPLQNITLGTLIHESLLNNSKTKSNNAMIDVFSGETISYKELLQQSCNLAHGLKKIGLGIESVISISCENCVYFHIPIIAGLYIGATLTPLNHNYTKTELRHVLSISKPRIIFCSVAVVKTYIDIQKEVDYIEKLVVVNRQQDFQGVESLYNFIRRLNNENVNIERFLPFSGSPNTTAFIMCSSGTTGLPKGVMLTHKNIVVRMNQNKDPLYKVYDENTKTVLGLMPFFHAYGLIMSISSLIEGYQIAVMKSFDEDLFLSSIEKYQINFLSLAPPLLVFLAKSPKVNKYNLSTIQKIFSGAAPLSREIEEEVKRRLNLPEIKQGYGLTESTLAVTIPGTNDYRPGSSGKMITFMQGKVRDPETGKSLGPNEVGELCFKGPLLMKGYYKNEKATKETFTSNGWLRTGDLGYYDEDGYFFIIDRLKELIKYKGFQVAPAELEAILLTHPKIKDVGVVGVPNDECGELPLAFVVKHDNVQLSESEVQKFVADQVSPQKRLRGGVIFLNQIPKNPSGKILRRELRQMVKNYKSKL